ncbi:ribosomal RNA-processing protein 7-domain-containing protein [Cristinia sonorae]|uniref:Ribosomal RNA-processing protein 7-domain-containing protein n=1 Tax=Cristinia sonorae TaxID=1940300 RepID=A0A8K0UJU3_9AGAR|nr:ribosomal RNA-processing protein 7-domain-containing protein [Cristinia sonorae]
MSTSTTISGFTPLRVTYSSSSTHIIYVRAHSGPSKKGKEAAFPEGRTLFLANVPPDATERELVLLFKSAGTVEMVIFNGDEEELGSVEEENSDEGESCEDDGEEIEEEVEEDSHPRKKRRTGKGAAKLTAPQVVLLPPRPARTFRKTGSTAHVIFTDASSIPRALAPSKKDRSWPSDPESPLGLAHYAALHASLRPPLDIVRAHADSWMELFDYEEAKKKKQGKYRKGEAIVDDDGFTLVTRGGAYGQTVGGGVGVASKQFQQEVRRGGGAARHRKKKEPAEKETFYAFQIHEKKRNDLIELKKKWEEDKAKVEKLKSSRTFKPY